MTALLESGGDPNFGMGTDVPTPFDIAILGSHRGVISVIKRFTAYRPDSLEDDEKQFGLDDALNEIYDSTPGKLAEEDVKAIVRRGIASLILSGWVTSAEEGEAVFQGTMETIRQAIEAGKIPSLEHLRGRLQNNKGGE